MALWGRYDDKSSTGTITIAANGLCTGVGTDFVAESKNGDFIIANSKKYIITSITNTTVCHVASGTLGGAVSTVSANQYALQESPKFVATSHVNDDANNVYGVDTTEAGVTGGPIISLELLTAGSGYTANATVTITGGGGSSGAANAAANSVGKISAINLTNGGSGYEYPPTVTIAAPSAVAFNANTDVAANGMITLSHKLQNGDLVTYAVAAGNTALAELTDGGQYYVVGSNSTVVYLAETAGGAAIELTKGATETGHTLQGETATAIVSELGGTIGKGVAHAGWVKRTVGTGGRAGRVQYEVLVASGTITSDAADDSQLPDSN